MKIKRDEAIIAILNVCIENLVTTRFLLDEVSHLAFPDDEAARLAHGLVIRQKVAEARITFSERVFAEVGSIDLEDLLGEDQ